MDVASAGPDTSPPPVNDEGFIDGEWPSDVAATVFVNAGKAGNGLAKWAGGTDGTQTFSPALVCALPVAGGRSVASGA